jgi:dynein heavy chain
VRRYEDLGGWAEVKSLVEGLLAAYNEKRPPLQLVFFEDALEHLTRIVRTLRLPQVGGGGGNGGWLAPQRCIPLLGRVGAAPAAAADALPPGSTPQGNCLLVGVGGSGKQSLARLAAYISGCEVFQVTLTRGYDEAAFRDDLRKLYQLLGAENKKVGGMVVLVVQLGPLLGVLCGG